ncbi:hypothetical protein B0I37DRAFT_382019 [Chaetomium sp. MPI-CAGE-AT-0009]|nr:hypothetical protein B0I37DRAFT_382019 [Chaetomium sp. MPI-CAGE-AT-0009]
MARRSKPRSKPRPPTFVWKRSDIYILLACLDYSLQHNLDFENIAITHIAKQTGKQVTTGLIQSALKKQTKGYGRNGQEWTVQDLRSEGSIFLEGYSDIDREKIREEISRIEPPRLRYWLRSTSMESPSRSRTLSSNRRPRSETSTLSSHPTPEFARLDEFVQQFNNAAQQKEKDEKQTAGHASTSRPGNRVPLQERTRTASLPSRVKTECGQGQSAEIPPNVSPTSTAGTRNDARMRELELELQRTLRENKEQKDYIFTLSNRLSEAEYECDKVRESARKAAEYRDDVLMQRDLRYENSILKGQLGQMTSQRQTIALASTGSLEPSTRTIWQEFECIATDVKDACSSVDITIPSGSSSTSVHGGQGAKEADAELWARRAAHCSLDQFLSLAIDTGVSEHHIVRALVAAGIRNLVFESRFPDLFARESPMLDQYRKHIFAGAGPQTLEQFEILAYKSVISEQYFVSHILQSSAKSLANKLYNALAHFISPNDDTMIGAEPEDGSVALAEEAHLSHIENPVASLFTEALVRALALKQELALSRTKYRLVFFQPGDLFNAENMIADGDGDSAFIPIRALGKDARKAWPRSRHMENGTRIKLCLFPALYSKRREEVTAEFGIGVDVRNCVVDCDNFITDDQTDVGDGSFSLVVKGVVLV